MSVREWEATATTESLCVKKLWPKQVSNSKSEIAITKRRSIGDFPLPTNSDNEMY
jgi:hypothetical protein